MPEVVVAEVVTHQEIVENQLVATVVVVTQEVHLELQMVMLILVVVAMVLEVVQIPEQVEVVLLL